MIEVNVQQFPDKVGEVKASLRKFNLRILHRMSGYTRAIEIDSMKRMPKGEASPAGSPPHTHPRTSKKGNTLPAFPQFIRYKVEDSEMNPHSVVGPTKPSTGKRANWAERIGHTHEFGGTSTVEKRVYRDKDDGQFRTGVDRVPLYVGEGRKLFHFTILEHHKPKMTKKGKPRKNSKEWMKISYKATYPKRPFAAPALRKTVAAVRQGKFGQ